MNQPCLRASTRPRCVTDEHLEYLDQLRDACTANMRHAAPHLADEFDLDRTTAAKVHGYWLRTFGDPNR